MRNNWKQMMSKIPASIKIGKHEYRVYWIKEFPKDEGQSGESSFGEDKQIVIKTGQSAKEAVHTFWHEVVHAIDFEYNIKLTENQVINFEKALREVLTLCTILQGSKNEAHKRVRRNLTRIRKSRQNIR